MLKTAMKIYDSKFKMNNDTSTLNTHLIRTPIRCNVKTIGYNNNTGIFSYIRVTLNYLHRNVCGVYDCINSIIHGIFI